MSQKDKKRMTTVVFKVEPELADVLNHLSNKSAFIRKAISEQLGFCCPMCLGKGHVPRGVHAHFAPLLAEHRRHPCDGCGEDLPILDESILSAHDRERLEQFFLGGPLYCDSCYQRAPTCEECGWHIGRDRLVDHVRSAHAELN